MEWSFNGTFLYNDSFYEIIYEGYRYTLVLKRVRRGDAGIVRVFFFKVTVIVRLEVKGEAFLRGLRGFFGTRVRFFLGFTWRFVFLFVYIFFVAKSVVFLKALDDVFAEERGTLIL